MNMRKIVPLALFLAIAGGLGYLLSERMSENTVYFYTVSEAWERVDDGQKALRISGKVLDGSIQKDKEKQILQFDMYGEDGVTMPVSYNGPIPDIFAADIEVIVEGHVKPDGFVANNLLAKCPSKYQKDGSREDFMESDIPHERAPTGDKS